MLLCRPLRLLLSGHGGDEKVHPEVGEREFREVRGQLAVAARQEVELEGAGLRVPEAL